LRLRNIQAFVKFKNLVPGFSATINRFEGHPDLIDEFVNIVSNTSLTYVTILIPSLQIAENASNARSEDVYKVRTRGIRHILGEDFETTCFNPPLDAYGDKIHRGWNHPQTARALCPMHSLGAFDQDPEYVTSP
jgi:hypothetical protein